MSNNFFKNSFKFQTKQLKPNVSHLYTSDTTASWALHHLQHIIHLEYNQIISVIHQRGDGSLLIQNVLRNGIYSMSWELKETLMSKNVYWASAFQVGPQGLQLQWQVFLCLLYVADAE